MRVCAPEPHYVVCSRSLSTPSEGVSGWCVLDLSADLSLMLCTLGNGKFPY